MTGNASKYGFRITVVGSNVGPAKFYGSWAYTAPGIDSAEARAARAS